MPATLAPSPPKKLYNGAHTKKGALPPRDASPWQPGPREYYNRRLEKKYKSSGKPVHHSRSHEHPHDYPRDNALLLRLSQHSSPSGTLLDRIEGMSSPERITHMSDDGVEEGADTDAELPVPATPHFYTPTPGEVERFLESVIGAPPAPPSPSGSDRTCSGNKPSLALETHDLLGNHRLVDPSGGVLYSPTQTAVNSLPSADQHSPMLLGDAMSSPSASAVEACKEHLVPAFLALARARDPGKHPDAEQCLALLSDDLCIDLVQKAKAMRHQLSSLLSPPKTPVRVRGSLKRDRVAHDEPEDGRGWNAHGRLPSANSVLSDVSSSKKDGDTTLVGDVTSGRSPPTAPRAMLLQGRSPPLNPDDGRAPDATLIGSPTALRGAEFAPSLTELAVRMFPVLAPTSQGVAATDTPPDVQMGEPPPPPPPEHTTTTTTTTDTGPPSHAQDIVVQRPTQAGTWFRQRGARHAGIVDVQIEVSDALFYLSAERQPSRLRMHLRLCSVPMGVLRDPDRGDDDVQPHVVQWPKKGKLVVQVNPDSERSKTWLPHALTSDPLDVTSCVQPGKNVFRFIQLSDLAGFGFVLVASPPPPEEEAWRGWDWASFVDTRRLSSPSMDDPTQSLAEFAHIPVTVLS